MVYFGWNSDTNPRETIVVVTDPSNTVPLPTITVGSGKGREILKSIVYGGLGQLLESIRVVISAATTDAAICINSTLFSPTFAFFFFGL